MRGVAYYSVLFSAKARILLLTEGLQVRVLPAEKIEERPSARVASNFPASSVIERLFLT